MTHAIVLSVAASLLFAAAAQAQSLADVARREAERRKSVPAGKLYTDDMLRPDPSSQAPVPGAEPLPAAASPQPEAQPGGEPEAAPEPEEPVRDQQSWRDRIQGERDALQRAEIFAEALQSRINALTADFTARDDPAQRSQVAADRERALAELDRVKQEIAQHTKAIADIQEEARRAGVPAGWVR